ncbi:hypothetical protein CBS115989_10415 [Aspergillus niger]|nr:hypothetical protein CBS115989_10415 [Aspergillus niger]KAI2826565.1 hypothetical protein CBS133816_7302 [Aspergillus niger]KAI2837996.1 hypothetical protein CBS11350_8388 [Aspergillus niger]KAI2839516.1 hypothetical protein CBS11232_9361 [Aspergillus niger]KAI2855052.1 hypothetical protein CBS12448_7432 [Aspergillus niger]
MTCNLLVTDQKRETTGLNSTRYPGFSLNPFRTNEINLCAPHSAVISVYSGLPHSLLLSIPPPPERGIL